MSNKMIEEIKNEVAKIKENRHSTSNKSKIDMIDFFGEDYLDKKILEIGTAFGHTTRILSFLFKEVHTIDIVEQNIKDAYEFNKDRNNIEYYEADVYNCEWPDEKFDVVFIDCVHAYDHVIKDIENAFKVLKPNGLIMFDDYGAPEDDMVGIPVMLAGKKSNGAPIEQLCTMEETTHTAYFSGRGRRIIDPNNKKYTLVKEAVDEYIDRGKLKIIYEIGYTEGDLHGPSCNLCDQIKPMRASEGVICQVI